MEEALRGATNFFIEHPIIMWGIGLFIVISIVISIIKKLAKIAIFIVIAGAFLSYFYGIDIWQGMKTMDALEERFNTEDIEIQEIDGEKVKAVIDGATYFLEVTDGEIAKSINKSGN